MWKCIRCEKENEDMVEICAECGHGRTMDYIYHRTLAKVSARLTKKWRISHNTQKEPAEEAGQKELSDLRSAVAYMKDEISKEQNEINTLHTIIEERRELIEKDAKADKKTTTIAWIICISLIVYIIYRYGFDGKITWDAVKQFWGLKTDGGLDIGNILSVVAMLVVCVIAFGVFMLCCGFVVIAIPAGIIYAIINLLIGRFIGKVSDKTRKQAETERDNAQKSIDEKKNKINAIYSEIALLEEEINEIETNSFS
ncbi:MULTISPECIES: hypothetical protein [Blautia]|uniref:hypothetical protein n=1 Tax=Blautia TaxID=572511 RepID=UPI00136B0E0F|nr:hypothetical protein [Blautia sp. BIOML-A1]MZT66966.1 hypothetical protein [Blautia sp. BIOML-A1]